MINVEDAARPGGPLRRNERQSLRGVLAERELEAEQRERQRWLRRHAKRLGVLVLGLPAAAIAIIETSSRLLEALFKLFAALHGAN